MKDRIREIAPNPERLKWIRELMKNTVRPARITVGRNTTIHHTAMFGSDGFTAERDEDGAFVRCPNYGDVVIGDGVRIGECSVVRRSTLPNTATVVGNRTAILSFVVVGHNCKVGEDCFIGNHVQLCGSVEVGDRCWISPHVSVHQHVKIGNDVTIGLGAVVVDDVPDGGVVAGVPAVPSEFADNHVHPGFKHGKNLEIGFYNCIHDKVLVGDDCVIKNHVEMREGTVVGHGCYIDSGVKFSGGCRIGNKVTLRYDAIIARGVIIEDDVYISPQVAFIAKPFIDFEDAFVSKRKRENIVVRKGARIGTGATIGNGVEIGKDVVIGANAFVNKDCPGPGTYVGVPIRIIK